MISVGILIGIIEDKIANDLSSGKTAKEHLEDIKEAIKNYKNSIKYMVKYKIDDEGKFHKFIILKYELKNEFLILTRENGEIIGINTDNIKDFIITPIFKEEVDKDDSMFSN